MSRLAFANKVFDLGPVASPGARSALMLPVPALGGSTPNVAAAVPTLGTSPEVREIIAADPLQPRQDDASTDIVTAVRAQTDLIARLLDSADGAGDLDGAAPVEPAPPPAGRPQTRDEPPAIEPAGGPAPVEPAPSPASHAPASQALERYAPKPDAPSVRASSESPPLEILNGPNVASTSSIVASGAAMHIEIERRGNAVKRMELPFKFAPGKGVPPAAGLMVGKLPDGLAFSRGASLGDRIWRVAARDLDAVMMIVGPRTPDTFELTFAVVDVRGMITRGMTVSYAMRGAPASKPVRGSAEPKSEAVFDVEGAGRVRKPVRADPHGAQRAAQRASPRAGALVAREGRSELGAKPAKSARAEAAPPKPKAEVWRPSNLANWPE